MSTQHADILDQQDSLRGAFVRSLVFHVAIAGSLALYTWWISSGDKFGDPNASGGAIGVEVVNKIPLAASRGIKNPVANDTDSDIPTPPPKPIEKEAEPEPDPNRETVNLKSNIKPKPQPPAVPKKFQTDVKPNQLTSDVGQRMASPLFAQAPGAGGVGTGPASSLGTRFGEYEARMRQIIASKWRTSDVDSNLRTAPVCIVTFEIMKDGSIRNVRVLQGSGTFSLDASTQRAVLDSSPLPPLPPAFERDSAKVEIWFQLKR
ncbi:MAG: TonB family protein [Bryobacteraceae bacterium]